MNQCITLQCQSEQNDIETKNIPNKQLFINRLSKLFLSAHPKCRECLFSLFCPFLYSDTSKTRFKAQKAIAFPFASYTLFDKKL